MPTLPDSASKRPMTRVEALSNGCRRRQKATGTLEQSRAAHGVSPSTHCDSWSELANPLNTYFAPRTLIRLDPSSPGRQFSCAGLGAGTVSDRHRPKTAARIGYIRAGFSLFPLGLGWVRKSSSWRKPRELVASCIVTTVDHSDIRGLVTGMRSIRQGLPLSTCGRRSPPCGRPKGAPRIPPTVQPTRPVPLALSLILT